MNDADEFLASLEAPPSPSHPCAWCRWTGDRAEREVNFCHVLELWLCRRCFFSRRYEAAMAKRPVM